MEEPIFTQWKQAQVTRVNTFFTEPTAGWKLKIHAKVKGPNMACEACRPAVTPPRDREEMVSKIMLQKQQNLNAQNVIIHYINSQNHDG